MIEIKKLESYNELPNISLDDVQKNPFTEYLNLCFGLILDDIEKKTGKKTELYDNISINEDYVKKNHDIQEAIISSLESIDYAIHFIGEYDENEYLKSDYIPFDKFAEYHYDVICHKVSTMKDLFLKLTNQTYNLGLGQKECKWKNIEDKKDIINNTDLFNLFEVNKVLNSDIKNRRNSSSHDGKISIPFLHDIRLYLWASKANETLSKFMVGNPNYERTSHEYSLQINMAKKKALEECKIIRYNIFAITKCILCSLLETLTENVEQLLPDLNKRVVDFLTNTK